MKNSKLLFSVIVIFIFCLNFCPNKSFAQEKVKISFKDKELKINAYTFQYPWSVAQMKEALGEPDRISNLANVLYTYDDEGLVFYQTTTDSLITEFHIIFEEGDFEHYPDYTFTGKLKFEKAKLKDNSSLDYLKEKLLDYNIQLSYSEEVYDGEFEDFYIFINFTDVELKKVESYSFGFNWQ